MKVIWSERADDDLYNIVEYISNDSIQNAFKIRDEVYAAVKNLEQFPNIGVDPKDDYLVQKGYRMLIVEKYLIFYLIENDEVNITAVIHGAMSYAHLLH